MRKYEFKTSLTSFSKKAKQGGAGADQEAELVPGGVAGNIINGVLGKNAKYM